MVAVLGGGGRTVGDGEDTQALPAFADGVGEVHMERFVAAAAHAEGERVNAGGGEGGEDVHDVV